MTGIEKDPQRTDHISEINPLAQHTPPPQSLAKQKSEKVWITGSSCAPSCILTAIYVTEEVIGNQRQRELVTQTRPPDILRIGSEPDGICLRVEHHVSYRAATAGDVGLAEEFLCCRIKADKPVRLWNGFHEPDPVPVVDGHRIRPGLFARGLPFPDPFCLRGVTSQIALRVVDVLDCAG